MNLPDDKGADDIAPAVGALPVDEVEGIGAIVVTMAELSDAGNGADTATPATGNLVVGVGVLAPNSVLDALLSCFFKRK